MISEKKYTVIGMRWCGLFSNFFHVLQHCRRSAITGRIPIVNWETGLYAKNLEIRENIWDYYFEPVSKYSIEDIELSLEEVKFTSKYLKTNLLGDPKLVWSYKTHPPKECLSYPSKKGREYVNNIIKTFIKLKTPINKKIDKFYDKNMKDKSVIGVHYRETGLYMTEKWMGKNPLRKCVGYIDDHLSKNSDSIIFLATDSHHAVDKFKKLYGDKIICYESIRSYNSNPIQFNFKTKKEALNKKITVGHQVGEEVLIECLLLSKCNILIHGVSNVSACSSFFNPHMNLNFTGRVY